SDIESLMSEYILTEIMAGGRGERLDPLTRERAKPAVPFGGEYRLIDFTLSNCINSGLRHIFVLVQYKSKSLTDHIQNAWSFLPRNLGQFIDSLHAQKRTGEDWYRGTADAVRQNFYHIQNLEIKPSHVLILSGDQIYKMDYRIMIQEHIDKKADMTISLIMKPVEEAKNQLGVIEVNEDDWVIGFEEKPDKPKKIPGYENDVYASMGIYIFKTDVLFDVLNKHVGDDFGKEIIPYMLNEGYKIYGYNFNKKNKIKDRIFIPQDDERKWIDVENISFSDYWVDAGTIKSFYDANMDLVGIQPKFDLYGRKWKIHTHIEPRSPVKQVFHSEISNSLISNGCIISGSKVYESVLSPDVTVEKSEIEKSIIFNNVQIGEGCYIKKAIIDKNCIITNRKEITPENAEKYFEKGVVVKDGIVVIPKWTRI
ncbi:MAG: glucose-1-phosphate adenylyltransferase, partial [Candidatus Aenigmatarchaeota archaeon]